MVIFQITGHKKTLEENPFLNQRLRLRDPIITTLNVCQAFTLKRIRDPKFHATLLPTETTSRDTKPADEFVKLNSSSEYPPGLEDTLIFTMKGIAAGMQNTG